MRLIGVVIWLSEDTGKALVWCDDGGPLALVGDIRSACAEDRPPGLGDLVQVACRENGTLRSCLEIGVLAEGAVPDPGGVMQQCATTQARGRVAAWPGTERGRGPGAVAAG